MKACSQLRRAHTAAKRDEEAHGTVSWNTRDLHGVENPIATRENGSTPNLFKPQPDAL
jgi:hypothetical protein